MFRRRDGFGGSGFNPAAPGAIGGTTPAAITGTTITATTGFVGGTVSGTTGTFSGAIVGLNSEIYVTATGSLSAAQVSGTIINNYGMTAADCTITLPAAATGYSFTVFLSTVQAFFFKIKANTGDKIYLSGVAGADNANVGVASGYAAGALCNFFSIKNTDGGFDWTASPVVGTWVAS